MICIVVISCILLFSCKKDDAATSSFSEARYRITITGHWQTPAFITPGSAHYTSFVGMVHNNNAYLWRSGTKASPGTEAVAESGNTIPILAEIDSMVASKNAIALFAFVPPSPTGTQSVNIYCNTDHSLISFESMLGPTPDWFIGLSGLDLYSNNTWIADTTVNLYAYDAGTEDGDMLGYNNPPSSPQQNIQILLASQATALANGNPVLAPIATARMTRQ